MIEQSINWVKVLPRIVTANNNGIRFFQKEALDEIKNGKNKNIIIESPVGSGKSYIIKLLINDALKINKKEPFKLFLTYPTKILINSQVNFLKEELKKQYIVEHWPYEQVSNKQCDITIFEYSTDALSYYFYDVYMNQNKNNFNDFYNELNNEIHKKNDIIINNSYNKGTLLYNILINHQNRSNCNIIVSTPDVLYLLLRKEYRNSNRILLNIKDAIIFFDEFHLYNFDNFTELLEKIDDLSKKNVFLSATPITDYIPNNKNDLKIISFDNLNLIGGKGNGDKTEIFNYSLDVILETVNYMSVDEVFQIIQKYLGKLEKPTIIIFDSVFRLRHIKLKMELLYSGEYNILEYSGMSKDNIFSIDERTIILGTSSIEVGITMFARSMITEVSYWTSAIQRIGRIGRKEKGQLIVITKSHDLKLDFTKQEYNRDEFENLFKKNLKNIKSNNILSSEVFRGESYPFLLIDKHTNMCIPYDETIFCMFDVEEYVYNWKKIKDINEKQNILKKYIDNELIKKILIRDAITPFCGIIIGNLKDKYTNIKIKKNKNNLCIIMENKDPLCFEIY